MKDDFRLAKEAEARGLLAEIGPMLNGAVNAITQVEALESTVLDKGVSEATLEALTIITGAINDLDESRRQLAAYLYEERQISLRPIGKALGVAPATVAKWIERVREDREERDTRGK